MQDRVYIIVGASRGLGASLVSKCLDSGFKVIGIGRTDESRIENAGDWKKAGLFRYVQADIGDPTSVGIMKPIINMCEGKPICIIFNAAVIESDVGYDRKINFDIFKKVNRTGIDGFGHILEVFGNYLLLSGSMLVGISSISAWMPPTGGNKIAYPSSKAYLDIMLRSLRLLWGKRVHLMTVHLGHMGGEGSWFVPTYDTVAERVVKATLSRRPPESVCMSAFYCVVYSALKFMPDRLVSNTVELIKKLVRPISPQKKLP